MNEKLKRLKEDFDKCKGEEDIFSLDISYMRKDGDDKAPEAFPIMNGEKVIGIAVKHSILISTWADYFECFVSDGKSMVQSKEGIFPSFWIKKR